MKVYINTQFWHDFTRIIVIDERHRGSIQADLFRDKQRFGGTAYIYGLWVDKDARDKKIATSLLKSIETVIKAHGHKSEFLEWQAKDSPMWVYDWYYRNGYVERAFTPNERSLLEKKLI